MKTISLKSFLHYFSRDKRESKKFCFILGAGASAASNIPTGKELAQKWFEELKIEILKEQEFNEWIDNKNIDENNLAKDYGQIYDKRYELDPKDGFDFLEKIMEKSEPSIGYAMLAQILTSSNNNIVITTNFDSLCEDALFIYTQKKPLVIGHESLAGFIQPNMSRPCIVKLHRDFLLSPKSKDSDTRTLSEKFKERLEEIFENYIPIVIGYGGNDESLMGFLKSLNYIEGYIYWFVRNKKANLNDDIQELLKKKDQGRIIEIAGFDDLMIQLGNKLGLKRLDNDILKVAEKRAEKYQQDFENITKEANAAKETKKALSDIVSRDKKDWLYYELKAAKEKDPNKADFIYKKGIKEFSKSFELHNNYANFLMDIQKDHDKAKTYYKKAIKLNPDYANAYGNYAVFLHNIQKDYDKAKTYYKKALKLNPDDALMNSNYAVFLHNIQKDYDKAEIYYKKALKLNPDHANANNNYANFLKNIQKDYNKAEIYYKKAIKLNPEHANFNGNYAVFLDDIQKDYNKAEIYYKKAIKLDPDNANVNGNYAKFLIVKEDLNNAEKFIEKAFSLNKNKDKSLNLELWFYCYAVFFNKHKDSRENIVKLLKQGITSPNWYLDDVIKAGEKLNHPNINDLKKLAKQISSID
ncbi:MAG: hypothetical protein B6I26_03140 [Desulfobacteraceae bacterium 4572_130]|nr:MAG: hypothetical protein B6I26_03140 [Desulfobacteraceae bacterium 4572_130]